MTIAGAERSLLYDTDTALSFSSQGCVGSHQMLLSPVEHSLNKLHS